MKLNNLSSLVTERQAVKPAARFCDTGVVCTVLMPHAPILVPGVGGARSSAASASCRAMCAAAKLLVNFRPDTVVLISPHSPRQPQAFGLWADNPLQGSFAQFNAPQIEVSLPLDSHLTQAIAAEMDTRGLETWTIRHHSLDHGALVPLWFLAEAGWARPTAILGLNYYGDDGLTTLGKAIAAATQTLSRRVAIVASGDMSHRLTANAPCGFHPQAHQFDESFIHLVRAGDFQRIADISPELRELAAEDVVDSTWIAVSAVNWQSTGHEVLSYEGPFGVGYGVAILFAAKPDALGTEAPNTFLEKSGGATLPGLARRSVETALLKSREQPPSPAGEYLNAQRGVFVTLRQRSGRLRGCVGTITAICPNIVAETWRSARLAALRDGRYASVTLAELTGLRFDVSVIHPATEVLSMTELDPGRYGVIVSTADGRRGVLLPGIQEIQTPEQQLRSARGKGYIDLDEPVTIEKFLVDHFEEPD